MVQHEENLNNIMLGRESGDWDRLDGLQTITLHRDLNTPRLMVLTIGISGSGKSTLIDHMYGNIPHVRLNRDSIRKELCGDEEDHSREVEVSRTVLIRLRDTLKDPNDRRPIIIDNTSVRYADRKDYYQMVGQVGLELGKDVELLIIHIDLTPDQAVERQLQRERQVPREAIEKQYRRVAKPELNEAQDGIPYKLLRITDHAFA